MNRLFSIYQLNSRISNISQLILWKRGIFTSTCTVDNSILYSTVRWKSKGSQSVNVKKIITRDDVVPEVFPLIKAERMEKEFNNLLSRFQTFLIQRLNLRMTPQLFADIMIPGENVKLGQVANLLLQNTSHQNITSSSAQNSRVSLGDQFLLVDLTGRPNLLTAARKAVIAFLDPCKDGSGESKLQPAGQHAFTIRLNTAITQESRQKALTQGRELLQQTIREMDKVHQTHMKLLNSKQVKQEISEDNLFIAREYLRVVVKEQHKLAETLWERKRVELEGGEDS